MKNESKQDRQKKKLRQRRRDNQEFLPSSARRRTTKKSDWERFFEKDKGHIPLDAELILLHNGCEGLVKDLPKTHLRVIFYNNLVLSHNFSPFAPSTRQRMRLIEKIGKAGLTMDPLDKQYYKAVTERINDEYDTTERDEYIRLWATRDEGGDIWHKVKPWQKKLDVLVRQMELDRKKSAWQEEKEERQAKALKDLWQFTREHFGKDHSNEDEEEDNTPAQDPARGAEDQLVEGLQEVTVQSGDGILPESLREKLAEMNII
ncbi:MAG: hypothetical protein M1812_003706 [Candelaria pacifica]|nr:MAG: hypothetical protein M1812_003706 [Candelaria pacifica]